MRVVVLAAIVLALLVSPVGAQSISYDFRWSVLCGPNAFDTDQSFAALYTGQMTIELTQRTDSTGHTFWEARNPSTGAVVFPYASAEGGVQEMNLPSPNCQGAWAGAFGWASFGYDAEDPLRAFVIGNAEPMSSRDTGRASAMAIKIGSTPAPPPPPPPPPSSATVTFTSPASGQVIGGTYGIKMTVSGLGAGPYKWFTSVDGKQISYRLESGTSLTVWWNTTTVPNGTHTISVRTVDAAGKEATGSVSVIVKN